MKKVITMFVALIVCVSCFAIVASASGYSNYEISTTTSVDGARKTMDASPANFIRYRNVKVSCTVTSARARVSLWGKAPIYNPWAPNFGYHYEADQTLSRGSNAYAWWQGTPAFTYLIHLEALNNQTSSGSRSTVTTNGTFENYVGPG